MDDIGKAAAAAIAAPERFDGVELELASDYLSMAEIAEVLSGVLGTRLRAGHDRGAGPRGGDACDGRLARVDERVGQPARPEYAKALGLSTTRFETWASKHMRAASLAGPE